ncbi:helix-turn-helix transcriptional regulator [Nocardia sp. NPDC055321]
MNHRQVAPGAVWLTRAQLAARTGFSEKTLRNWASTTPRIGPPFSRFGGRVRYRLVDVIAWEGGRLTSPQQVA